ncbi:MAG: glycosyltransferase [Acidobacteriaceae bacterium]|nr:glycosyltransferase [Acidobacteriaceae bacterium]
MRIVIFGLSITSSWGNGHATTYRALVSGLHRRGHKIVFFEKNQEWYESNRDLPNPDFCQLRLFQDWSSISPIVRRELRDCDVAVVGSYFPDGLDAVQEVLDSNVPVKAFYDIDTPITISNLRDGTAGYLEARQVPGFDLYFSFTGGPLLKKLQSEFGAVRAVPLYCSFEENKYYPRKTYRRYQNHLSYMGTYAEDRQDKLQALFIEPASAAPDFKFVLAGPQYPRKLKWPDNIRHIKHLSPRWHPHFYSSSRVTLNLTRQAMVDCGFSPSVRLFEAAACGCPIVSDYWPGLETFLRINEEILIARSCSEVLCVIRDVEEGQLRGIAERARERVLSEHSSQCRAEEFENYVATAKSSKKAMNLTAAMPSNSESFDTQETSELITS